MEEAAIDLGAYRWGWGETAWGWRHHQAGLALPLGISLSEKTRDHGAIPQAGSPRAKLQGKQRQ